MFEAQAQMLVAQSDPFAVDALAATAPTTVERAERIDPAFVLSKIETGVVGFQKLLPRWRTQSRRTDVVHVQAAVLEAVKVAFDEAGIDMSSPTQVVLIHDQTEESDGLRGGQREGWPKRLGSGQPRPTRDLRGGVESAGAGERA